MSSNLLIFLPKLPHPSPIPSKLPPQTLTISSSLSPPSSKEEAISQAKLCLSHSLQKPLKKLKKLSQPRLRIEIPISDQTSTPSLAFDLFSSSKSNLLLFWPSPSLIDPARRAFSSSNSTSHSHISSPSNDSINSADLVVFVSPEKSMLGEIRAITNRLSPRPAVLLNPRWGFEEEKGFGGGLRGFVGSFDVVYCFMGLEVRGVLSRRKGAVFKAGKDGWLVMVEEEGELKVVSRFDRRPEIGEVESVLYNLMAANSPVTRSVKFFRDLASNVFEKKKE